MTVNDRLEPEHLGTWLKAKREALGLSLREVERATEGAISNAAISQLETGKVLNPSLLTAAWLGVVYDIPSAEIMDRALAGTHYDPPPTCPTCGQIWRDAR